MFRPGRKEQAGTEHPSDQPQTPNSAFGSTSTANSTPTTSRPPEPTSFTGASSMNETPNSGRATSESESLARDIKEGTLSGFVGNGTTLTGEANFKGMLRVDGHLSGRVSSQDGTLIVSTGGQVDANIEVSVAQIYGTVIGDIIASKRIELGRVAKVTGNIQTPALVIEQGALFEGSCRMVELREAQDKQSGVSPAAKSNAPGATSSSPSNTPARNEPAKPAESSSAASSPAGIASAGAAKPTTDSAPKSSSVST